MSPLWAKTIKIIRKGKYAKLPSPNLFRSLRDPAQDPNLIFFGIKSRIITIRNRLIKGTSLPILPGRAVRGSMTVEAALVVPLFLFFFLNLGSAMEILRFHGRVETALWSVGREMCIYGHLLADHELEQERDGEWEELLESIGSFALSRTYVNSRILEYLGRDYLDNSPIRDGSSGLDYRDCEFMGQGDHIELTVSYRVKPMVGMAAFSEFRLRNRYYGRLWTGYELTGEKEEVYYLAEYGEVFHRDRSCSYLHVTVNALAFYELDGARTEDGGYYRPCEKCSGNGGSQQVWVTPQGDCYHTRRDCPGLRRNFRTVDWEEAKEYRPCSRCGRGDG